MDDRRNRPEYDNSPKKWRYNFSKSLFTFWKNVKMYGDKNERMRTAEISTDFKLGESTLEVGAKFRPFRMNKTYDYVDSVVNFGEGTYGTDLVIKQNKIDFIDAFGGAAKGRRKEEPCGERRHEGAGGTYGG